MNWKAIIDTLWFGSLLWYLADQFYFARKRAEKLRDIMVKSIIEKLKEDDRVLVIDNHDKAVMVPSREVEV
jgi:hypothetical protein